MTAVNIKQAADAVLCQETRPSSSTSVSLLSGSSPSLRSSLLRPSSLLLSALHLRASPSPRVISPGLRSAFSYSFSPWTQLCSKTSLNCKTAECNVAKE